MEGIGLEAMAVHSWANVGQKAFSRAGSRFLSV